MKSSKNAGREFKVLNKCLICPMYIGKRTKRIVPLVSAKEWEVPTQSDSPIVNQ